MPRRSSKTAKSKELDITSDTERKIQILREQVKGMLDECYDEQKKMISAVKANIKLAQRQISKDERQRLVEPCEQLVANCVRPLLVANDVIDDRLTSIKTTVKKTARKRKNESAKKPCPPSTLKRSRRNRTNTDDSSDQELGMSTPMNSKLTGNMTRNIFITPKINPMTPLNKTIHRQAKPNETLFSLSGSPVNAVQTTARQKKKAEEFAQVTLGSNLTLNLPFFSNFEHAGLDLDDDQLNKLSVLNQGISNMLKQRM